MNNKIGQATSAYCPEWCEDVACASNGDVIGVSLTRQGDVLVLDGGTLRFSYRLGLWRYWNHNHLIDLLRNAARAQRVSPKSIPRVVRALYRSALDVSFRRTGGLFVLLKNQRSIRSLVRQGDAIADNDRGELESSFDKVLPSKSILQLSRRTIAELAAADGAIVLNKKGEILAYGAVLEPKQRGTIHRAEGSRTKAAIGASHYGIAVKISSDGDIAVYFKGKRFVQV
jgi:DNA integrity scanning protein DisA with diadenylate cyclase activity